MINPTAYINVDLIKCQQPVCPDLNQPMCATNGQRFIHFKNRCTMKLYNYRMKQSNIRRDFDESFLNHTLKYLIGFSPTADEHLCTEAAAFAVCPEICPAVYDPVCGRSGNVYVRFGNACELNVYNCKYRDRTFN